ncbi:MAG: LPS-assembly protein LptD, partial [Proteobacteria bacterium]|nr:LPS-assembly protein LptD [Pseudomonadota bacterium]
APTPSLYPPTLKGVVRIVAQWADSQLFPVAMAHNFKPEAAQTFFANQDPEHIKAFVADRTAMRGGAARMPASDAAAMYKSYLRRYRFSSDDILVNRAYLEGFKGRHYAAANMYYFQDLRPGRRQEDPFVTPEISISALGEPGKTLGGRWSLNGGFLATDRNSNVDPIYQGPDTRRLSAQAGWDREFVSSTGFLTTLSGMARADGYWSDNVRRPRITTPTSSADFQDIAEVRQFAQGSVQLRYPLGRRAAHYQQIIEPIGVLMVAPRIDQNSNLPNEDSLDVEFDETNLFRSNRYTGYDRVEGGTRAAYGFRHSLIGDNGARVEFVGGQVFRLLGGDEEARARDRQVEVRGGRLGQALLADILVRLSLHAAGAVGLVLRTRGHQGREVGIAGGHADDVRLGAVMIGEGGTG